MYITVCAFKPYFGEISQPSPSIGLPSSIIIELYIIFMTALCITNLLRFQSYSFSISFLHIAERSANHININLILEFQVLPSPYKEHAQMPPIIFLVGPRTSQLTSLPPSINVPASLTNSGDIVQETSTRRRFPSCHWAFALPLPRSRHRPPALASSSRPVSTSSGGVGSGASDEDASSSSSPSEREGRGGLHLLPQGLVRASPSLGERSGPLFPFAAWYLALYSYFETESVTLERFVAKGRT